MRHAGAVATEVSREGEVGSAREPGARSAAPSAWRAASSWIATAWARVTDGGPESRSTGGETAGCAEQPVEGIAARVPCVRTGSAAAAVLLTGLASAVAASAAEVRIVVEDVLGDRGTILGALCDSETYLTGSCPYGGAAPARDGKVVLTIPDVAPGGYAALVFHDENDNLTFDTGSGGIPVEGYGFSNDALGQYGPPKYEDAEVTIHEGTNVVSILLVY